MRRNSRTAHVVERSDENPVYGMYYFANGEHIDNTTVEAHLADNFLDLTFAIKFFVSLVFTHFTRLS